MLSQASPRCIERERQALLSFQQGVIDHYNRLSSGTTIREDCCAWYGITCDNRTNRVITLDLNPFSHGDAWYSIGGDIDSSLVELRNLKHLDLSFNDFTRIPKYIGSLTKVTYLNLARNNGMSGSIPSQIGNLTGLRWLDLCNNFLVKEPPWKSVPNIGAFSYDLEELFLDGNSFEGPLPESYKVVANNQLNGSSRDSVGHLHSVEILDVSLNSFTGAVSELHLEKLSELKTLDLSLSPLTSNFSSNWVPPFQLNTMALSSCKFGPQFPNWLRNQFNLFYLDTSDNVISQPIPNWFCNVSSKLQYLYLSFNYINGMMPNFPLTSTFDREVDLSCNQIHGLIPPSLSNATEPNLSNNVFTKLEHFLWLRFLDVGDNKLNGQAPKWTGESL
ncbi:hypothetical protein FNV43_RR14907 [Rhamnella rubrinervis]|uniref:Leucine-rich repeat-containing N-terminal plant-type domain-containing protein n=1 Tax=Rhamnella rubrinervis TaxID=2594499 RepID=A0A8K0H481_9ROSA|nr:hypothetical protein FNV43_RR14907 [Rhamnella rubrinervis]